MISIDKLKPAIKFPLSYFIKESMKLNNWTENDLSNAMGISNSELNDIMKDEKPIERKTAFKLGKVFKTSGEFWLNLSHDYLDWKNGKS